MFEKLRLLRQENHLTCEDMSEIIGLKTRGAYHKKENGIVPFRLDEAQKIAVRFNRPIEEIFFEHEVSKMDTFGGGDNPQ